MKLFRTNRLTYEGLRISLDLYKLDKSENTKDTISFFAKTMIYDVIIDISLVVVLSLCVLQCISPDGRWFSWIFASAGVYGLELIIVNVINLFTMQKSTVKQVSHSARRKSRTTRQGQPLILAVLTNNGYAFSRAS